MKTRVAVLQFSAVCPEGNEHSLACGITHEVARRLTAPGGMEASAILLGNANSVAPGHGKDVEGATGLTVPSLGARYESDYVLLGQVRIVDGLLLTYEIYEVEGGELVHSGAVNGLRSRVFRLLEQVANEARHALGLFAEDELEIDVDPVSDNVDFEAFVEYCLGRGVERPVEALEHLERALRIEPAFRSALVEYLSNCYQLDDTASSLPLLDAYLDKQPEDTEMLVAAANLCLSFNMVDAGISYAARCVHYRPQDVEPRLLMTRFLLAKEMVSEATKHLEVALSSPDRSPESRYCLGRYYLDLGDVYRARDYFEECLQCDPGYLVALRDLQCCYYELGDFAEGIRACEDLLDLDPSDAGSLYNLGLIYQRTGRTHLAKKFYEEALRQDPAFYKSAFMIGEYHYSLRDFEEAARAFDKARRMSGGSAEALGRLADCHYESGRIREAYRHYVWARREDPLFESARFRLIEGCALVEDGNLEAGQACLLKAAELDEKLTVAWNELAWVLLRQGRAEEALNVLRRALDLEPDNPALLGNLLTCYRRLPLGIRLAGWTRKLARDAKKQLRRLRARGVTPPVANQRRVRRVFGSLTWYALQG
ncbi:MAG: tetratricopeptide repeat protein [Candidatus Bipolaricaulota bacterium]|nr:MAG: tetratricopeptide repeat protein [Candidatus Bipolaricaulota bacterium]